MPAFEIRSRLLPHKILTLLLFTPLDQIEWAERVGKDSVRIITGDAARSLRMKNSALWDALHWLADQKLVKKIKKEKKRGTAIIVLKQPINIVAE